MHRRTSARAVNRRQELLNIKTRKGEANAPETVALERRNPLLGQQLWFGGRDEQHIIDTAGSQ